MIKQSQEGRIVADYNELIPEDFIRARDQQAVVYLPFGSIEWHNNHLPFNTDSIIAEDLCRRLAEHTGGLILPVNHWASACAFGKHGPYKFAPAAGTIALFDDRLVADLLRAIVRGIVDNGFKRIVVLAGHVGGDDRGAMETVVEEVNQGGLARAMYLYPYLYTKGDHAGHWETLMLLGLRPDLVRPGKEYIKYEYGHDLTGTETAAEGREKIDKLVCVLCDNIDKYFELRS